MPGLAVSMLGPADSTPGLAVSMLGPVGRGCSPAAREAACFAPAGPTSSNRCVAVASTSSVGFWKSAADGQRSGPPLRPFLFGISLTSAIRQKWKPRFS